MVLSSGLAYPTTVAARSDAVHLQNHEGGKRGEIENKKDITA